MSPVGLLRRDDDPYDPEFGGFFYSDEGRTIRYGILLGIIFIFFAFLLISYQHANMRMRKGLPPLRYHRVTFRAFSLPQISMSKQQKKKGIMRLTSWATVQWLVSAKRRAEFEPQSTSPEHNFSFYAHDHAMHPMPPPAYNPNYVQPPAYPGPPDGASKTAPQQNYGPTPTYPGYGGESSSAPPAPAPPASGPATGPAASGPSTIAQP